MINKTKRAKIFICHHPSSLLLFENFSKIIKQKNQKTKVILLKVNHPYFLDFNFESHKKYFDQIIEFDFVHYKRNFIKGYWQIINFIRNLKNVEKNILNNFDKIDLFLEDSAWLPVNIMLYNFSKNKKINNVIRIVGIDTIKKNRKTDKFRTFLRNFYTLPFPCYPVNFTVSQDGIFANFQYQKDVPGKKIKIVSPVNFKEKIDSVPFPIISEDKNEGKKDMILIMGDGNIYKEFPEYFSSYEDFLHKTTSFLKAIEDKYRDCKIYYKSHPADKNKLMPGIDKKRHIIFDNKKNAQMIFNDYHKRIKAVYTVFSTSVISSSYFGIPSYTFYRYFTNNAGKKRIDSVFLADNITSPFLFNAESLEDVGKIDNIERPEIFGLKDKKNRKIYEVINLNN